MIGWATVPDGGDEWHAFAGERGESMTSRCARVTLPAGQVGELERVPRGRPCFPCLIEATETLPQVDQTDTLS